MAERDFTNEVKIISVERKLEERVRKSCNRLGYKGTGHGNFFF